MATVDPIKFVSVLESVLIEINNGLDISLSAATKLVVDKVTNSKVSVEGKQAILGPLDSLTHVHPVNMRDTHSLVGYLYNSILKYKGLGVIKDPK